MKDYFSRSRLLGWFSYSEQLRIVRADCFICDLDEGYREILASHEKENRDHDVGECEDCTFRLTDADIEFVKRKVNFELNFARMHASSRRFAFDMPFLLDAYDDARERCGKRGCRCHHIRLAHAMINDTTIRHIDGCCSDVDAVIALHDESFSSIDRIRGWPQRFRRTLEAIVDGQASLVSFCEDTSALCISRVMATPYFGPLAGRADI